MKRTVLTCISLVFAFLLLAASPAPVCAQECTTIQSGALLSAGAVITTGYDDWGYNYQARIFM